MRPVRAILSGVFAGDVQRVRSLYLLPENRVPHLRPQVHL